MCFFLFGYSPLSCRFTIFESAASRFPLNISNGCIVLNKVVAHCSIMGSSDTIVVLSELAMKQ